MMGEVKLLSAAARGSGGHGHKLPLWDIEIRQKETLLPAEGEQPWGRQQGGGVSPSWGAAGLRCAK